MQSRLHNLLLADDDPDDCLLFSEALKELKLNSNLNVVNDGVELMETLKTNADCLPQVVFLDLNMPLKNGVECLLEIKETETLNNLPVIIYSTSYDLDVVNLLYNKGAHHYIRKPAEFAQLKKVIQEAVKIVDQDRILQPPRDKFVIIS